jgi:hypothetical protein
MIWWSRAVAIVVADIRTVAIPAMQIAAKDLGREARDEGGWGTANSIYAKGNSNLGRTDIDSSAKLPLNSLSTILTQTVLSHLFITIPSSESP